MIKEKILDIIDKSFHEALEVASLAGMFDELLLFTEDINPSLFWKRNEEGFFDVYINGKKEIENIKTTIILSKIISFLKEKNLIVSKEKIKRLKYYDNLLFYKKNNIMFYLENLKNKRKDKYMYDVFLSKIDKEKREIEKIIHLIK